MRHDINYDGKKKIWFSSDFHFNHKNIVRGESSWDTGTRDFDTLFDHDMTLINNINNVVGEDDILYFLGDFCFGNFKEGDDNHVTRMMQLYRNKINCRHIHFILGNHDEPLYNDWDLPTDILGETHKVSSLFSSVHRILDLHIKIIQHNKKAIKLNMVLCHYAMRVWDKSHVGSIMIFGHSHGMLDDNKPDFPEPNWIGDGYFIKNSKSMDVGVDCHPEFRPFELMEILEIMNEREILMNFNK